jgi:broad specificity phosphatase PhoE
MDGDGTVIWRDAHLVEAGIQQARTLGQFWIDSVRDDKIPIPATLYTSPLARCLETSKLVFSGLMKENGRPYRPIVKELLRERLTDHTCDERSSRTWIASNYPDYIIEPGFTEKDLLWRADRWETDEEHVARKQRVLDDIFATDSNPFISFTVHSYAIAAILALVGAKPFRIREGSTIPLFVKAERAAGPTA